MRGRHWIAVASFVLLVALPAALTGWYLWTRAADQYASTVGFSVRREEVGSAIEILGGITQLSGSSSTDTDILYEFLQSQKLVAAMDDRLDLRAMWSLPQNDPIFSFDADGAIEDLVTYWERMVRIHYDGASGLIEIRVLAFTAQDATLIAESLFEESSKMINELSAIAREDSIRYAREELESAIVRLKEARQAVNTFRNRNQLIDPTIDLQSQAGLLGTLEAQLAESLIEMDLLRETTTQNDPRLAQAQRRVDVIESRISAERDKMGITGGAVEGDAFAELVGEYEGLAVDREFAEQSYLASLATYDAALAESRRKSRYLAAHILPTTAETARFPERGVIFALISLFLFLAWSILILVAYSLKDRR